MKIPEVSVADMENRVARYKEMQGASLAYLDQRIPGHEREIINLVGFASMTENVIENKDDPTTAPLIPFAAHGFNVQIARAEHGGGAALHNHQTEEVFMPMIGNWSIFWLEGEQEREVILEPFDVIHLPTLIFRGFRYVGEGTGALLAVVGGPDEGKIDWHPEVIEKARATGLEIDDNGVMMEVAG